MHPGRAPKLASIVAALALAAAGSFAAALVACSTGADVSTRDGSVGPGQNDATGRVFQGPPTSLPRSSGEDAAASAPTSPASPSGGTTKGGGFVIDHTAVDAFERIPAEYVAAARKLKVFYGRLSHGDQLIGGLKMIEKAKGGAFAEAGSVEQFYSSLDPGRETPDWEGATRTRLAKIGAGLDVVMWAWSGNVGRPDRGGTTDYIAKTNASLEKLETDYPKIRFVYMTGPAQTYKGATDYAKNNAQVRKFAMDHGKVLFDFEDIDLHSPDGAAHLDATDACEWCDAWCAHHDCSAADPSDKCVENHHTHCFNVLQKGKATWVLLARLAGWNGK